jgi:spore maturation protein CgeB
MRIFQVIESSTNLVLASNFTWHRNLYEPLVEMGHEVFLFSAVPGRKAMQRKDASARAAFSQNMLDTFKREHKKSHFDLFFAYLMDDMVESSVIDEIRRLGVPTCNFSCNNIHQFYLVEKLSLHFDFNLHAEKSAREKFLAIGAKPIWWQMASNPKYFKPYDVPRSVDVSFVGANYAMRARYIHHLLKNEIDVHAYGPGWQGGATTSLRSITKRYLFLLQAITAKSKQKQARSSALLADHDFRRYLSSEFAQNVHAPISDEELIGLYSKSKISLGFLEVYDQHDPSQEVKRHLHLREFEAPMSGALYCTGYTNELAEFFEPDKEVIVYRSEEELLEKVRYFLRNTEQAEKIREAGYIRALAEHTYHARYKKLFTEIGLK